MRWPNSPRIWRRHRTEAAPAGMVGLGSGHATSLGISPKAAMLDRAAYSGLEVPPGFVIPHGTTIETSQVQRWCEEVGVDDAGRSVGLRRRGSWRHEPGRVVRQRTSRQTGGR